MAVKKKVVRRTKKTISKKKDSPQFSVRGFLDELGIAREGVISAYESEENPDDLGPETYIQMQNNDGEIQGIVRLLTLPIISTLFHIIPAVDDNGERDFVDVILNAPPSMGGMSTPLPFVIADMTRAISEGFRLYEKVARVIDGGEYKGKIGWQKLAPRDAQTITLKPDEHGGFDGAHQSAMLGGKMIEVDIPVEKCMLFTFQKEKHWLYGESILKTAYYHYDKKHKLYYLAHKRAEIDTLGLKVLKMDATKSPAERTAAENAIDQIGINTRVTLPTGVELEIERMSGGYDPMPLILHHNMMMVKSALAQSVSSEQYAYPYGKGTPSSQYLVLSIESIMRQMEATINAYVIAPLIDWNFGTTAYPTLKFDHISDIAQDFLKETFNNIMKSNKPLPEGFVNEVIAETAKALKLKWVFPIEGDKNYKAALKAFEKGKLATADKLKIKAPSTPQNIKDKLLKAKNNSETLDKCYKLGEDFAKMYGR